MQYIRCIFGCCAGSAKNVGRGEDDTDGLVVEKTVTSNSGTTDLMVDEGANYQQDLWQQTLHEKLLQIRRRPIHLNIEFNHLSAPETFIQVLTASYNSNGFAQLVPRLRKTFLAIEPFVTAINTMVTSTMIAPLVWRSLMLIFQSVLRFSNLFDQTNQMLLDLSKELPRFQAYTEIFHTPQLHRALREVYDGFVGFCFRTVEVLQSNTCYAMLRGRWLNLTAEFEQMKDWLKSASTEFEREARMADVQEQFRRHREVLAKIDSLSSPTESRMSPGTNVRIPRNDRFTGRADTLTLLHAELSPSFQADNVSLRARCSCTIHAIGGMGKTETALEYTYRYGHCYTHVFWLRAQTNTSLLGSFMEVVSELNLDVTEASSDKKVQAGLTWLQTTMNPWLLIFDNAENSSVIRKFLPAGNCGAIIITTQNPQLALITKSEIQLEAMNSEEGSALIQSFLKRGGSEQQAAQKLSTSLGGLPLAIAHFAGYVARSQCPLDQICNSLNNRIKSSQVWKANNVLPHGDYEMTLNTVWDLALRRLSDDSRRLLEFFAFLDPDQVPVEMFIGSELMTDTAGWQYWDTDRFDAAIEPLLERHLVDRYILPAGHYIKTHRALQRAILQNLDADLAKRQSVFDEVVHIARKAFPVANIITRGDTSQYQRSARYMIQIMSIHSVFTQSDPIIQKRLLFAQVLSDVGYYGVNNAIQAEALSLLRTAESICTELLQSKADEVYPILGDILGPMQVIIQYLGVEGRHQALTINERTLVIRKKQKAEIPREQWTQLDFVNFGRTHNDMGVSLSQLNRVQEAKPWFDSALGFYKLAGSEETLTSRFGHIYCFQLLPLAVAQRRTETRTLANRSLALIAKATGLNSPLHLQTKFLVAMAFFTIGDIQEALELHKETFEKRLNVQGSSHHLTLASQYCLGVCYQSIGDLGNAKMLLKEVLANSCVTMAWRDEDVLRTRFRLSLVLQTQKKTEGGNDVAEEEAAKISEDISLTIQELRQTSPAQSSYTDEDDMKLLDFGVSIFHGRTTGIWSNGTSW